MLHLILSVFFAQAWAGGSAWLSPESVVVATKDTVTFHYVVGPEGMAVGDGISVADPEFHGIRWAQFGKDVLDPSACTDFTGDEDPSRSYLSASTTGSATISLSRNVGDDGGTGGTPAATELRIEAGTLSPGDELIIVYGDTSTNPLCGHEMPDRAFHEVLFRVSEDLAGSGLVALASFPTLDILPLSTPTSLLAIVPSRVVAGQPFRLKVASLDVHGNPAEGSGTTATVEAAFGGANLNVDQGWANTEITLDTPGIYRIAVTSTAGLSATSNPVDVVAAAPENYLYWGDLHVHFGHTIETDGLHIDENVTYARDVVGMDVVSESVKADPICIDGPTLWENVKANCQGETVEGSFVYMLGMEWMGTEVEGSNGHHNMYYNTCDAPYAAHYDAAAFPAGINGFSSGYGPYEWAAEREAEGTETVIIPHATRMTGFNWDAVNNDYRRSAEIYSEWGFSIDPPTQANSIPAGLAKGNRMGFIGASDNHVGWMGNPYSYKNTPSGLAGFWAPALTRADVFSALKNRATYATSGDRIILETWIEDGAVIPSGSNYVAKNPDIYWKVHGTDTITKIDVYAVKIVSGDVARAVYSVEPNALDAEGRFEWGWSGDDEAVWLAVTQADGEQAWSTPTWLTENCAADEVIDPATYCDDPPDTDIPDETGDTDAPVDSAVDSAVVDSAPADTSDTGTEKEACGDCAGGGVPGLVVGLGALAAARRRRGAARS